MKKEILRCCIIILKGITLALERVDYVDVEENSSPIKGFLLICGQIEIIPKNDMLVIF